MGTRLLAELFEQRMRAYNRRGFYAKGSRIQKSGTGDNNFVKWKGTFRSDRPKRPDRSKVISNIPVEPNRNGPFHLISNRNFRNFGLNGKRP